MQSALEPSTDGAERPPGLGATTMCEAFQMAAATYADEVALRTINGGVSITFAGYAERVERLAGALHSLGVAHRARCTATDPAEPQGTSCSSRHSMPGQTRC
jgi:hypothetical protein